MNLKIDINKLEVKYIIGNYRDLKGYPTSKDIIYSIIQWIVAEEKDKNVTFSDNFISKLMNIDIEKTKILVEQLVDDKYLEHIKDTKVKSIYTVIKNPFE